LYSWNSIKSIGKFALIDDGSLQVVHKLDRSVVINTFQSSNNFVLDLVLSESVSLADDMDYDFWHAALGHLVQSKCELETLRRWIPNPGLSVYFTCNRYALSKSKHKVQSQLSPNQ
jgi:hypothetical protein